MLWGYGGRITKEKYEMKRRGWLNQKLKTGDQARWSGHIPLEKNLQEARRCWQGSQQTRIIPKGGEKKEIEKVEAAPPKPW